MQVGTTDTILQLGPLRTQLKADADRLKRDP
jgi:hypothetical protein